MLHVDIVFSFVVCFGKSWFVVLKQYSLFNRFSRYYMSLKVGLVQSSIIRLASEDKETTRSYIIINLCLLLLLLLKELAPQ